MTIHECPDRDYDEIEIYTNGDVEIEYDVDEYYGTVSMSWRWCPYCGVKLDDSEPVAVKSDCNCINFWHGRCMNCGRPNY